MDIVERLRSHWGGERIADVSIDVADAADEIERLRIKKQVAVEWIKELMDFLEFIYNHPEFENSLKAYEWIMFQIEMIMAKYNEPVGEDR
jgi:hypothetical protein